MWKEEYPYNQEIREKEWHILHIKERRAPKIIHVLKTNRAVSLDKIAG
jgi:hypothetical protein